MTHDAPLWTNEDKPTICPKCNAHRGAMFELARGLGHVRTIPVIVRARELIRACPLCAAAWKEANRA